MSNTKIKIFLIFIAASFLLLACSPWWPKNYNLFLSWVIFIIAGFIALLAYMSQEKSWAFVFLLVIFLYNPILPVPLPDTYHTVAYLGTAIIFFLALILLKLDKDNV